MQVYISKHLQCQTSLLGVNQMHVEVFLGNVFLLGTYFCMNELT